MKLNKKTEQIKTHEGGIAKHINPEQQLRRSVMACLLFENGFYEEGQSVADRITETIKQVDPAMCMAIAIEARNKMKLRHAPLLIARVMASLTTHKHLVADTLAEIIQRPDELSEFVSIYWKDGKHPLSAQVKKGLARAFTKFNEYSLAKWNRDGAIKLRDVLFLAHPKPLNPEQDALWKRLINNELVTPDTWEVELSANKDKKAAWTRLLSENKLAVMALLRNLRNIKQADVDDSLVTTAIENVKVEKALPFRFISASRYAPQWEPSLEIAMLKCLATRDKLPGHTVLLIDVSGSMDEKISCKSEITRLDAACGVAMLAREICERVDIFTFSLKLIQIPARRGFALRDAIVGSQQHSGTPLGEAVRCIYADRSHTVKWVEFGYNQLHADYQGQNLRPDRLIVITDEQSADRVPDPIGKGYMINVATSQNGVGYAAWCHIDGWSEAVIDYIVESEREPV